jgi:hypothetical protein
MHRSSAENSEVVLPRSQRWPVCARRSVSVYFKTPVLYTIGAMVRWRVGVLCRLWSLALTVPYSAIWCCSAHLLGLGRG